MSAWLGFEGAIQADWIVSETGRLGSNSGRRNSK
jgi:hypothetical protein